MPTRKGRSGGELFIVDNSDDEWKVVRYLQDWARYAAGLDIATAYFEIGSLLALDSDWQQINNIRVLMGDEVSKRTKRAFEEGLADIRERLNQSIEAEKEKNDFLEGVPAIVDAIRKGQIACRVYRKDKFHAKAYITHAREEVLGSAALVGSSNFTKPGLCDNVELNVRLAGAEVGVLQEWYEDHWDKAEDVTTDILTTIERHVTDYSPFEVYAQSLHYLFREAPSTASEWEEKGPEKGGSRVFRILDRYQQTGYRNLVEIAGKYRGAFLCDGVGLGKTFVGMMLLERLVRQERMKVALIVPKGARETVWEPTLREHCPELLHTAFSTLEIINHTDITREKGQDRDWPAVMEDIRQNADAIVIDEAHHFRNPGVQVDVEPGSGRLVSKSGKKPSRYRRLFHMLEGPNGPKQVYLLTATPVNNHMDDLRHMIELFTRRDDKYFGERLGINSLRAHFVKLEKDLEALSSRDSADDDTGQTDMDEAEELLQDDRIFSALVVQRSRAYVQESQRQQHGAATVFPKREDPKVADYSVRKVYGRLLDTVERAFERDKPLFRLGIYYPYAYFRDKLTTTEEKILANRQKQVIGLVRTNFLKRFESSPTAFEASCERLLLKLLAWAQVHAADRHEKDRLAKWKLRFEKILGRVEEHLNLASRHQRVLFEDDAEEDLIPPEMLEDVDEIDDKLFDVPAIFNDTLDDLDQLAEFLEELQKFKPQHDDKLRKLRELLSKDSVLKAHKVLIFTEFADTARYLARELADAGIEGAERIDGATSPAERLEMIRRFSPYYNGSSSAEVARKYGSEIRVLISTDVLSEGLNLQDATRLINYDLHWNPVRLMQRIGRVDRRLNPAVEARLVADHPDQKDLRGKVAYWNFLPPGDLDRLLRLYRRVSHKTLRISAVFGIEGRKLLRPEDDFEALRNFNEKYLGTKSEREKLRLEYEKLLEAAPELAARLDGLPGRLFSGRERPRTEGTPLTGRGVFFCYALPGKAADAPEEAPIDQQWTEAAGEVRWYLLDLDSGAIAEDIGPIAEMIRSDPETPRRCIIERPTLAEARSQVEKHIRSSYLRSVNAPAGVRQRLVAWMELN